MCMHVCVRSGDIYIYRERERDRDSYIQREREYMLCMCTAFATRIRNRLSMTGAWGRSAAHDAGIVGTAGGGLQNGAARYVPTLSLHA